MRKFRSSEKRAPHRDDEAIQAERPDLTGYGNFSLARHFQGTFAGSRVNNKGENMAKRKYDPNKLTQAAAAWDIHHALVAAVRRLVKLSGGVQEAKDVIDAIAAADALEEEQDEAG
jgi:hypothetical protein